MRKSLSVVGCLLVLVAAAGCGAKLDIEKTLEVTPNEAKMVIIEKINREQKVRVQWKSEGGAVNVDCFLEKDQKEVEGARLSGKKSDKVLASEEKKEEAELVVTVPANNEAVVMVSSASGKNAKVKVKLTNR